MAGWQYDGQTAPVQAAALGALAAVQSAIAALLTAPMCRAQLAQDLAALAAVAPDQPGAYASQLGTLLADYVSGVLNGAAPAPDDLPSGYQNWSRLPPMPADPSYGLAALAALGAQYNVATATGIAAANFWTLMGLVGGLATASLVQLYAQTQFASAGDADTARETVYALVVAQIAAATGNDALVQSWRGVLTAAVTDLTTRAKGLPNIASFATASPMPAAWLAQRLYQDGSQGSVLVQRNAVPHPLFMPLEIEYLQS